MKHNLFGAAVSAVAFGVVSQAAAITITSTPGMDFNGSTVVVSDAGTGTATLSVNGKSYTQTLVEGSTTFTVPADVVVADTVYDATVTVGGTEYTARLHQGNEIGYTPITWFTEVATSPTAARWGGTAPTVVDSRFSFTDDADDLTVEKYSPTGSQTDRLAIMELDISFTEPIADAALPDMTDAQAGIRLVESDSKYYFSYYKSGAWGTNTTTEAERDTVYAVRVTLDRVNMTVCYEVKEQGVSSYATLYSDSSTSVSKAVTCVDFAGEGTLGTLTGNNSEDTATAYICQVGDTKYQSLNEVRTSADTVSLLWDASWKVNSEATCSISGDWSLLIKSGSGKVGCGSLPSKTTLEGGKYTSAAPGWTIQDGYSCIALAAADGDYTHEVVVGTYVIPDTKVYATSTGGDIAFSEAVLEANGYIDTSSSKSVTEQLNDAGANQNPTWENAVLGLSNTDAADKPVPQQVQSANTELVFQLGNVDVDTTTSANVTYAVYASDTQGVEGEKVSDDTAYDATAAVTLPTSGVKYYTLKVTAVGAK